MRKTITIFCCLAIAFVCVQPSVARKGISTEEKEELEKRFQGLESFYIDDDGAVVYLQKEAAKDSTSQSAAQQPVATASPVKTKIKVYINEWGEYVVSSEETTNELYDGQEIPTEGSATQANEDITDEEESITTGNAEVAIQENADTASPTDEISDIQQPESSKEANTNKKVSSFKSLEMAMADVDQLLEELKKMQHQKTGKERSSLSQRASSGVDGSLREQTYKFEESEPEQPEATIYNEEQSEANGDPTYYINGVEATKKDVNKLKTSDILKKVIKTSKTNPNGEWWIDTRIKE